MQFKVYLIYVCVHMMEIVDELFDRYARATMKSTSAHMQTISLLGTPRKLLGTPRKPKSRQQLLSVVWSTSVSTATEVYQTLRDFC